MPAPKGHAPYAGCETGGVEKIYDKEFIDNEADEFLKWMDDPKSVYFKRFALTRGYHPNRLHEFAKQNEKFACVYERSKAWQETRISEGALFNELNSGFSKFFMGNVCGWADRTETKISGDAENPLGCILMNVSGKTKELVDGEEAAE